MNVKKPPHYKVAFFKVLDFIWISDYMTCDLCLIFYSLTPGELKKASQNLSLSSPCEAFDGILALILKGIIFARTKDATSKGGMTLI
jgi:hypothetical protein